MPLNYALISMKKLLFAIFGLTLSVTILSSCLGDSSYSYYDDTAITSFALGTLNRYYTVEASDGSDSIYKRTLSCSSYTFYIDHTGGGDYGTEGLIWNPDSLPTQIDMTKVICTIGTKNSGTVVIKSMISDTLSYYSSSDSIDFSEPRTMYVYSANGTAYRSYTVCVNKHQEVSDTCIWTSLGKNSTLASLTNMRGQSDGENVFVSGKLNGETVVYSSAVNDGKTWTVCSVDDLPTPIEGTNGEQIVGRSSVKLYAISDNKLVSSEDEGATWVEEELDDDASLLPTENLSFACRTMGTNADTEKLVLIGTRSTTDYPSDTCAVVWSKVEEYSSGARSHVWNYVNFDIDNINNRPPAAANWQITNYDENNIKAVCGKPNTGVNATALDRIYHSGDDGITWRNDSIMSLPEDISCSETEFAFFSDGVDSVWLICGTSGQVWKGRINYVAWKKEDTIFIKEED